MSDAKSQREFVRDSKLPKIANIGTKGRCSRVSIRGSKGSEGSNSDRLGCDYNTFPEIRL